MKLASYSTEGKFEGFKELGIGWDKFIYAGTHISVPFPNLTREERAGATVSLGNVEDYSHSNLLKNIFKRDEKDPLNRFNGLFNGRTFGNGKFVLESSHIMPKLNYLFDSDVVSYAMLARSNMEPSSKYWLVANYRFTSFFPHNFNSVGNLHENPELWEKLK